MTQAAIYTRVSTDEQAQTGTSLATQEDACRAYCERAGWEVVAVESDEGVSGATMVRPALARVYAPVGAHARVTYLLYGPGTA
jgi:site-specific DNA recombinase